MNTKLLLLLGAVGLGSLTMMSFSKAPKKELQPQPHNPPVVILDVVIPPVVIPQPDPLPIIPDVVVADPIQYVAPEKELNIVSVKLTSKRWTSTGYILTLNLQFTNNTSNSISLSEVSKISVSRTDGTKYLGEAIVGFNDITLQPLQTLILQDVVLKGLVSDGLSYYSSNFNDRVSFKAIYGGIADPTIVIEAPDVMENDQYILKPSSVVAYPTLKNATRFLPPAEHEFDYNIILENNISQDFYLNTVKAIRLNFMFGYDYIALSDTPLSFTNIVVRSGEQLALQNVKLVVPYDFKSKSLAFVIRESDLERKVKLELLT